MQSCLLTLALGTLPEDVRITATKRKKRELHLILQKRKTTLDAGESLLTLAMDSFKPASGHKFFIYCVLNLQSTYFTLKSTEPSR